MCLSDRSDQCLMFVFKYLSDQGLSLFSVDGYIQSKKTDSIAVCDISISVVVFDLTVKPTSVRKQAHEDHQWMN